MADFEGLLKKTLAIVNEGYQKAYNDVNTIVDSLDTAIKKNVGDKFALSASIARSDIKGVVLRIFLDTNIDDSMAETINITHILVPPLGYPLRHGMYNHKTSTFSHGGRLNDLEELELFFSNFLAEPESPLIQAIGYAMRSGGTGDDEDDEDDELPF